MAQHRTTQPAIWHELNHLRVPQRNTSRPGGHCSRSSVGDRRRVHNYSMVILPHSARYARNARIARGPARTQGEHDKCGLLTWPATPTTIAPSSPWPSSIAAVGETKRYRAQN